MSVVFKQEGAFSPAQHLTVVQRKLDLYKDEISLNLIDLLGDFRLIPYCTTENYQFHLGFGSTETPHKDRPRYQALAILKHNRWVVKGQPQNCQTTYQRDGDLIVLDTSLKHEVTWDWNAQKPVAPWFYLFIDPYSTQKWLKSTVKLPEAEQMAVAAIHELQNPVLLNWLLA